jgi:hypothetical protein|nr:MAG TPA: hypothetical protein [Caudoviricetes sp.]
MIGRHADVADRTAMAKVIADICLRDHPGPDYLVEAPLTDSEAATLHIYLDDQDLLTVHVGRAGVTMYAGRSIVDMPYQCDAHPADVANQLLGTMMKGTLR